MSPYSIPLWTIFTKWPEPGPPMWPQPIGSLSVAGGASTLNSGSSRLTGSSSPPTIMQ